MTSHAIRGVCMVLAAALLWGTTGTAQSLIPSQLSSYWVGTLRLIMAALFFLPWIWLSCRKTMARSLTPPLPWWGILAAGVCMCTYNLAFFTGVRSMGVALGTAVALGSGPVWAGILQSVLDRRLPVVRWWMGTGLAAAAASAYGLGMCLMAGLSYATYAVVNKRLVAAAPVGLVTAAVFLSAASLAVPVTLALVGPPSLGINELAVAVWLGVMSTGVAYLLFSHALRHIASATAVALALAEPVTAFVLAILVVGERPGAAAIVGLITVLAGLGLVIRQEVSRAG